MDNEGLLTTPEVAERLGITIPRVHQLIKDGRLPSKQFGRTHLIKETDLALVSDRKPGRPKKTEGESETPPAPPPYPPFPTTTKTKKAPTAEAKRAAAAKTMRK